MKGIRKIAGKVTALAVAITTTVALLSPYDANATSGISTGGGGTDPQFNCKLKPCLYWEVFLMEEIEYYSGSGSNSRSGSGGGNIGRNGGSLNGSGSSSNSNSNVTKKHTYNARVCSAPGGCLTSCTEVNGKTGAQVTKSCTGKALN